MNRESPRFSPAVTALIALAAGGLSGAGLVLSLAAPPGGDRVLVGILHVLLIATPVAVGLYALRRDPESRFAKVLVAAGFLWAPSLLAAAQNSVPYSIGRVASWFVLLSLVAVVLMFPSGRLSGRVDRALVVAAVALIGTLYLPVALLTSHYPVPSPFSPCRHACPPNAFMVVDTEPGVVGSVITPLREVLSVALFFATAIVLAVKVARASRLMRRTLTPVLAGAMFALVASGAFLIARRADPGAPIARTLGYVAVFATPAVVAGLVVGLLRWRALATTALQKLTREFDRASSGVRVRELLADAVGDPSLDIAYWTGDPGRWVNAAGTPLMLPVDDPTRATTEIASNGRVVATLIHDAALVGEPNVREVAGGFALMALENLRLDAELHSSLRELSESRARILSAIDLERERIERDLHDGAQQRLVALRVGLEVAAETLEQNPESTRELLEKLGADVQGTLNELRALARGVYPPLLADHGIGEALRMAARTSMLPTTVRSKGVGRYSQQIESAVYFCCLEGLQNAAKHSGADSAEIHLWEDEELRFEVRDHGGGFAARRTRGMGLDHMRDRIASLGGRLTITSVPGEGTVVAGSVPVGLAQLTPDAEMLLQRATDALETCFAIYRGARDSSGAIIDFTVEHINDAACRDLDRTRESQLGRTLGYLDPDYLGSELFTWHRHALESDGPSSLDEVFYERSAEGRQLRKAYEVRAVPLDGARLAVTWREITERKRKEDELLLEAAVLDRAAGGVCLVRVSDGVIVFANPRFADIYGYEPGDLDGRHVSILNWDDEPGEPSSMAGEILGALDGRGEVSYQARYRRKDGRAVWSEAHATAFEHPTHGEVWVIVHQDVTARRAAESALRLWRERVRETVRAAPLVLYTTDAELRCTWLFDGDSGLDGDDAVVGLTNEEIFGAAMGAKLMRINARALTGVATRAQLDLDIEDGPCRFDVAVAPVSDDRNRIVGVAGSIHEIAAGERLADPARDWARPRRFARAVRNG